MLQRLGAIAFPMECPGCGRPAEPVCVNCVRLLRAPTPAAPPPGVDGWVAAFAYEGVAREVVARVKYRRAHSATDWLAAAIVDAWVASTGLSPRLVTWVPTSAARRRERGFDHAALLARGVARRLRAPARALLARGAAPAQTGRPAPQRREGPDFSLRRRPGPGPVLLVDDVATTGASLRVAAATLRAAGACSVWAAVAARTPPPGARL